MTSGLRLLGHTAVKNDSHASTAVRDDGGEGWEGGAAAVLWRTTHLGGAQCTKTPRNGIPGYPTPHPPLETE